MKAQIVALLDDNVRHDDGGKYGSLASLNVSSFVSEVSKFTNRFCVRMYFVVLFVCFFYHLYFETTSMKFIP